MTAQIIGDSLRAEDDVPHSGDLTLRISGMLKMKPERGTLWERAAESGQSK